MVPQISQIFKMLKMHAKKIANFGHHFGKLLKKSRALSHWCPRKTKFAKSIKNLSFFLCNINIKINFILRSHLTTNVVQHWYSHHSDQFYSLVSVLVLDKWSLWYTCLCRAWRNSGRWWSACTTSWWWVLWASFVWLIRPFFVYIKISCETKT